MIKYANGSKDTFTKSDTLLVPTKPAEVKTASTDNMFLKGQKDASIYYTKHTGAGAGTLVTTLMFGIFGLIPAIACSSTTPKDVNLGYPNADLMKNTDYHNGYLIGAKKKKSNKVWTNFGIAVGVNLIAFIIISSGDGN
jgi:hypothetical protein